MAFTKEEKPARKILGSATVTIGDNDTLNVRRSPVKTAPVLKTVKNGEKFNVTEGSNKEFTAIIVDDVVAYVATQFVAVVMN